MASEGKRGEEVGADWRFVAPAEGGRIDGQRGADALFCGVGQGAGRDAGIGEVAGHRFGAGDGAVGDGDRADAGVEQGDDDATGCAASTEDEGVALGEGEIALRERLDEAVGVGVVAEEPAIVVEHQRVDSSGPPGEVAGPVDGGGEGFLVRDSDVRAVDLAGADRRESLSDLVLRCLPEFVSDRDAERIESDLLEDGRERVLDRIADQADASGDGACHCVAPSCAVLA